MKWEELSIYQQVHLILQLLYFIVLPADGHASVTIIISLANELTSYKALV